MSQSAPQVGGVDERDRPEEKSQPAVDIDLLTDLIASVLASEGIPAGAEASLTLVDPAVIAQLKAEHLDGDGTPTDVLSFPIDGADGDDPDHWLVGDIVVCPEVAAAQAPGHAGNAADEMALLVVHGALHLVGWDHADASSQEAMWQRERELMSEFYRLPELDPWVDLEGKS